MAGDFQFGLELEHFRRKRKLLNSSYFWLSTTQKQYIVPTAYLIDAYFLITLQQGSVISCLFDLEEEV